jgi:CPA2 family monovalent cation:H+ antiporter-2
MLASHALVLLGVPIARVVRRFREVREQRYDLMRGFFHGATDAADDLDDARQPRLHSVVLNPGAWAVGRNLGETDLERFGVSVSLIRRRGIRAVSPTPEARLEAGDVVVLLGEPDGLAAGENRLRFQGVNQRV